MVQVKSVDVDLLVKNPLEKTAYQHPILATSIPNSTNVFNRDRPALKCPCTKQYSEMVSYKL